MAMAKTQVQAQSQAQATMKVDPEEMIEIAEEMARVMEEKWHEERGILDDLDADLFSTILACKEDHVELITIIEVLQEQIAVIERSLQESSDNGHSSTSRIELVKQRDNLLLRERLLKEEESTSLQEKMEAFIDQRESLQSKRESLKKLVTEMQINKNLQTLCASTFHLIPSDEGNNRVAGNLVDSNGHVIDTFGFDTDDMDSFEVCEKLWSLCFRY